MKFPLFATVVFGILGASVTKGDGVLEARLTSGAQANEYRYSRRDDVVRIEDTHVPEKGAAPPVNLLDLENGILTIFYPHNSTYVKIDAERLAARPAPAMGPRPGPDMPASSEQASSPSKDAAIQMPTPPPLPDLPAGIGPRGAGPGPDAKRKMPEMATPPDMPELPPGIGPKRGGPDADAAGHSPGGPPGMPAMSGMAGIPPMPPMPGTEGETEPTFEKTNETRKIHGLTCSKYILQDPREGALEVWAMEKLIPFYLLVQEAPRFRGRLDFFESWPTMLREKGLFPMLAILKEESGGRERLRFEVTKYDPKQKMDDPSQFEVPTNFHEIEPPPF